MAFNKDVALVKLNGTLIKQDGTEGKHNFFKFLDLYPDDYSDVAYTPAEAEKIRGHLSFLSTGSSAAIPLICAGPGKCPFSFQCPFVRLDKQRRAADPSAKLTTPVGRACLVELQLINEWTRLYMVEYEIDEHCFTEFQMVRELAEIELMLWRLNNNLAKPEHAQLVQENVVGIDKQGNQVTRLEVSSLFEAKERLQTRKSKLVKLMVGDRQEKYKRDAALKTKSEDDPSTSAAQLRGQLGRLMQAAKGLDLQLKEAEGSVIECNVETKMPTTEEAPQVLSPEDLIEE